MPHGDADSPPPPPRPADHPAGLPWPPAFPEYAPDSPARSDEESKQAFNEQAARAAFGDAFIDALRMRHVRRAFRGDWWMLAMLLRCEEAAKAADPKGEDEERLAWWNSRCDHCRGEDVLVHLEGANLRCAHLEHVSLWGAHLEGVNLRVAHLQHADLRSVYFEAADLSESHLEHAKFLGAHLKGAIFFHAHFRLADLRFADVSAAKISNADLRGARGLFGKNRAIARSQPIEEYQAQNAIYRWEWTHGTGSVWSRACSLLRQWCSDLVERARAIVNDPAAVKRFARWILKDRIDWEFLRYIGTLRLFGVSYLTVAAITIYILFARRYNALAAHVRETAQTTLEEAGEAVPFWATAMLRLPDLPTPGHLGWQLVMTIVLAIAATIYVLFCPSEVKEATEVRWTRAMGQPLWEYRSANWCRPIARYICFVCFAGGGLYSVVYLGSRAFEAARYLLGGG